MTECWEKYGFNRGYGNPFGIELSHALRGLAKAQQERYEILGHDEDSYAKDPLCKFGSTSTLANNILFPDEHLIDNHAPHTAVSYSNGKPTDFTKSFSDYKSKTESISGHAFSQSYYPSNNNIYLAGTFNQSQYARQCYIMRNLFRYVKADTLEYKVKITSRTGSSGVSYRGTEQNPYNDWMAQTFSAALQNVTTETQEYSFYLPYVWNSFVYDYNRVYCHADLHGNVDTNYCQFTIEKVDRIEIAPSNTSLRMFFKLATSAIKNSLGDALGYWQSMPSYSTDYYESTGAYVIDLSSIPLPTFKAIPESYDIYAHQNMSEFQTITVYEPFVDIAPLLHFFHPVQPGEPDADGVVRS